MSLRGVNLLLFNHEAIWNMEHRYFVYMMSNSRKRALYTGVTNNLEVRVFQHKNRNDPKCFTAKYNCVKLVWFDDTDSIEEAIAYEKKIKAGSRRKKELLIRALNPKWEDLSKAW